MAYLGEQLVNYSPSLLAFILRRKALFNYHLSTVSFGATYFNISVVTNLFKLFNYDKYCI